MDRKKRILLIDDEVSFARLARMVLEASGRYEVQTVHRALEAEAAVSSFNPDLILLDVVMPDASGIEVAKRLRADKSHARIPIIFLTAAVSREDPAMWKSEVEGLSYKIEDAVLLDNPVLAKPVGSSDLMARIDEVLGK